MPQVASRTTDVVGLLEATSLLLGADFEQHSEEVLTWHPAPGEWCVKECVAHVVEVERHFTSSIGRAIGRATEPRTASAESPLRGASLSCERDGPEMIREFIRVRRASVELVSSLRDVDLALTVGGPTSDRTVADLVGALTGHDRGHYRQIAATIEAGTAAASCDAAGEPKAT